MVKKTVLIVMLFSFLLPARSHAEEAGQAKVVVEIPRTQWCQCVRALLNVEGGNIAGCVKSGASEEKLKIFRNRGAGTGNTTVAALLTFAGCSESENENVGSLTFNIQWQDRAVGSQPSQEGATVRSPGASVAPITCEAGNISAIEATLYRQNRTKLASAGPWTCSNPVSRLNTIPAATNIRMIVLGKNAAGEVLYRGEQDGVTITYKQNTALGTIKATPFTPALSAPANDELRPTGRVRFAWAAPSGASSYRLQVSDNPQFTTLVIDTNMISAFYETVADLKSRTYYWRVKAADAFKSGGPWSQPWSITVDAEPPVNTTTAQFINNGATITNSSAVSLAISATKRTGVAAYYISERPEKPDARKAHWVAIASVPSYSAVIPYTLSKGDGKKQIHVWFKDALGRLSRVQTGSIALDTTLPHAVITNHPSNPTNTTSARFTFTSSKPGSTFQCRLDSEEYSACTGTASYQGLSEGSHTFTVKATDRANNVDPEPASFTWTIDSAPPRTTITSKPRSRTSSTSAGFGFTSTKNVSTFRCRLDNGAFADCNSPRNYTGLAAGSHTFSVAAVDALGTIDPAPAEYTWLIDTTPFGTTITSQPSDPTNATTATFGFTSPKSGPKFQCALDGGGYSFCDSPKTYTGLADGFHTFKVVEIGDLGNEEASPAQYSWVIKVPPVNTTPRDFINRRGLYFTYDRIVKLSLSATSDKGVTGYYASERPEKPDAADPGWTKFSPAREYSRVVEYTLSENTGKKTVYVWFKDDSGNMSEVQSDSIYRFNANSVILLFLILQAVMIFG
ncbi:MAG TPA: hypothetical protein VIX18_12295 [Nitrospirota bacterium]